MGMMQLYLFSIGENSKIVEISGRLIAYLGVLESGCAGWISDSASVFMMQTADVGEGNDRSLVQ